MRNVVIGKIFLLVLAFAATAQAAAQESDLYPGVIGSDDRMPVEMDGPPWDAVGQVNIGGFRRALRCTGTLIAPDIVITAAHCVVDPRRRAPFPLRNIHFLAGVRGERHKGHATARCVEILTGYDLGTHSRRPSLEIMARDAALIFLQQKLSVEPVRLARPGPPDPNAPLLHAAYAGDRRYGLSAHADCQRLPSADPRPLWHTDCDTHPASSGGPVFQVEGAEAVLAAIMVGTGGGAATYALPVSEWRRLIEQGQCR
jgi:protease YdgD